MYIKQIGIKNQIDIITICHCETFLFLHQVCNKKQNTGLVGTFELMYNPVRILYIPYNPENKPGAYFRSKNFFLGLFSRGLIFGGAYFRGGLFSGLYCILLLIYMTE